MNSGKKENLKDFIKKEIKRSGFPLEALSSIILDKNGWDVTPHLLFFNELKECFNEIDIYASKQSKRKEFNDAMETLIIECKKQEKKPWVFFRQNKLNTDFSTLNVTPESAKESFSKGFSHHYYHRRKPCGYHFPTFVAKGKPDVILDAINHLLDSLNFAQNATSRLNEKYGVRLLEVFYPVIIFDGELFSARIKPNGDIRITKSRHLQLKVCRAIKEPKLIELSSIEMQWEISREYMIDIVTKDSLDDFLKYFP